MRNVGYYYLESKKCICRWDGESWYKPFKPNHKLQDVNESLGIIPINNPTYHTRSEIARLRFDDFAKEFGQWSGMGSLQGDRPKRLYAKMGQCYRIWNHYDEIFRKHVHPTNSR